MNEKITELIAKRHPTKEHARIEVYGKKDIVYCKMNNLSTSGAFFEIMNTTYNPKIGDLVRVTVNLRQVNRSHTLNGEVIWSNTTGLGVSFIKQKDLMDKLSK